jgi:hypothetical protein
MKENIQNLKRSVRRSNKRRFKYFSSRYRKKGDESEGKGEKYGTLTVSFDESLNGVKESELWNALN